ncbi:MAG: alpha/beta hydrolase [Gammaproteobacteria bacterium]|nr:alpha/beta hydrolase [Gammaproteobacteria bacterium]
MNLGITKDETRKSGEQPAFYINGPEGRLEAVLSIPQSGKKKIIAVVCHPHPLYDDSLNNKVTYTIARTLSQQGVTALRFNFRGVGDSEGEYSEGVGEAEDLKAVIAYVRKTYPGHALWLAGFSFGAYVSLKVSTQTVVDRLITVAPPVNFFDFRSLTTPSCPWLVIQGNDDEIVPFDEVQLWLDDLLRAPDVIVLSNVGHFFHRQLNALRESIESFIMPVFSAHHNALPQAAG